MQLDARAETRNVNSTSISFTFLILLIGILGYSVREEFYWSASHGLGYALGIAGGLMMLALLSYPLHKRFQIMGSILPVQRWFQIHMVLGILGPVCILFHCNFSLGSINSNVALGSMLLMVASGLIGRYLYTKIHNGLYGSKLTLHKLRETKDSAFEQLSDDSHSRMPLLGDELLMRLESYERKALEKRNIVSSALRVLTMGPRTQWTYWVTRISLMRRKREILSSQNSNGLVAEYELSCQYARDYIRTIRRLVQLGFYERLFALWHLLHLPIFFMLIATGFIHVYAVHFY